MNKLEWGLAVWVPSFLLLELPAHWGLVPWPTLSGTVWLGVKDWHPVAYFVAAGLLILYLHFDWHWSAAWVIAIAVIAATAIAIHVLTR